MAASVGEDGEDAWADFLGTVGLLLNVGGVIAAAVWFSMIGGAYPGGSATVAGAATFGAFTTSLLCFAHR